jgi:hypothetical protein
MLSNEMGKWTSDLGMRGVGDAAPYGLCFERAV